MRVLLVMTAALLVGCSFPDVQIVPADGAVDGADSSMASDAEDGSADETGDATTEDASHDADAKSDAPADVIKIDGGGPCPTAADPCDCDGDGDRRPTDGCGGHDCDDTDKLRNSNVSAYLDVDPTGHTGNGDWNCNSKIERELGDGGFSCGVLGLSGCAGASGYQESMPACGKSAHKITCAVSGGVLCAQSSSTVVTVGCK